MGGSWSKKIKDALSLLGYAVGIIALLLYIWGDKVFDISGNIYKSAIYLAVIGYIVFFSATLIISLIFRLNGFSHSTDTLMLSTQKMDSSIISIKDENEKLDQLVKDFSEILEKEHHIITQAEIDKYVLDSKRVIELESSVGNCPGNRQCKIYIQSSLFILEKGPLEKAVLWNLRKGVKYIYIIPSKEVYINDYYDMLRDWYKAFAKFLNSKSDYDEFTDMLMQEPEYKQYWSRDYTKLYENARKLWYNQAISEGRREDMHKSYCKTCETLFLKLIETHVDDESEFYITVATYETDRNHWEAIIKLPTQNINDEYYAFQIPTINSAEKSDFIRSFQGRYKNCQYVENKPSTLGGVLELDASRIFE